MLWVSGKQQHQEDTMTTTTKTFSKGDQVQITNGYARGIYGVVTHVIESDIDPAHTLYLVTHGAGDLDYEQRKGRGLKLIAAAPTAPAEPTIEDLRAELGATYTTAPVGTDQPAAAAPAVRDVVTVPGNGSGLMNQPAPGRWVVIATKGDGAYLKLAPVSQIDAERPETTWRVAGAVRRSRHQLVARPAAPVPGEVAALLALMNNARNAMDGLIGVEGLETVVAEARRVLTDAKARFDELFPAGQQ
jgi:hypothetical protein